MLMLSISSISRPFILLLPLIGALTLGCDKEKHCLDCETRLVERAWIFGDSVVVAKMDGNRGFCSKESLGKAHEKKEALQERAAHHHELLRAFTDTSYEGFYTGERSIDSEEDLHSMLDNPRRSHPFIIRILECDNYTEPY